VSSEYASLCTILAVLKSENSWRRTFEGTTARLAEWLLRPKTTD
jgi:hypothetical protein